MKYLVLDFEAIIVDARYQDITEAFKDVVVNIDNTKIDTNPH